MLPSLVMQAMQKKRRVDGLSGGGFEAASLSLSAQGDNSEPQLERASALLHLPPPIRLTY